MGLSCTVLAVPWFNMADFVSSKGPHHEITPYTIGDDGLTK